MPSEASCFGVTCLLAHSDVVGVVSLCPGRGGGGVGPAAASLGWDGDFLAVCGCGPLRTASGPLRSIQPPGFVLSEVTTFVAMSGLDANHCMTLVACAIDGRD